MRKALSHSDISRRREGKFSGTCNLLVTSSVYLATDFSSEASSIIQYPLTAQVCDNSLSSPDLHVGGEKENLLFVLEGTFFGARPNR